jgi:hypothetical protein
MKKESESVWQERVAAWRASGQTQKAFCEGKSYSRYSISDWARKFARRDNFGSSPRKVILTEVVRALERKPAEVFAIVAQRGSLRVTLDARSEPGHLGNVFRALDALP